MNVEDGVRLALMALVMPLWVLAGLADWWSHRRTRIERTSGLRENLFHWLLLAEGGLVLVPAALLEVDAGVLLLVFAGFLAHEATTFVELRYTVPRRVVRPSEQMVHSFMEILPLAVLALLAATRWDEALALFGAGTPDFGLRLKPRPWPAAYLVGLVGAVALLNVLPLAEEGLRCRRERRF